MSFIHLTRNSSKQPYGFDFKTLTYDGKHVAVNIIPGSPADLAGLREGDYILEVNGELVSGIWHDAVTLKMNAYPRRLDLTVSNNLGNYIKVRRDTLLPQRLLSDDFETKSIVSYKSSKSTYLKENSIEKENSSPVLRRNLKANDKDEVNADRRSLKDPRLISKPKNVDEINTERIDLIKKEQRQPLQSIPPKPERKVPIRDDIKTEPYDYARKSSVNESITESRISNDLDSETYARLIRLFPQSGNDLSSYGFGFRTFKKEGPHAFVNVVPNNPAFEAGINDGDFILEVNSEPITGLSHSQVLRKILSNPSYVDLLVVNDLDGYLNAAQQSSQKNYLKLNGDETNRYYVRKPADSPLGIRIEKGVIIDVQPESPAERAGLRKGLKIIKVNDTNVLEKTNKEIANLIRENENFLVLDVLKIYESNEPPKTPSVLRKIADSDNADRKSVHSLRKSKSYDESENLPDLRLKRKTFANTQHISDVSENRLRNFPNSRDLANGSAVLRSNGPSNIIRRNEIRSNNIDVSREGYISPGGTPGSRVLNLTSQPGFNGFGFCLKILRPELPAAITEIDDNSPAFKAGLKKDDLLLKVDDIDVANEKFPDIINLMVNRLKNPSVKLEVIQQSLYQPDHRFKRCILTLIPEFNGFGLTLNQDSFPKFMITNVELYSPAYRANLKKYDIIVEINKTNIRRLKYSTVLVLLEKAATTVGSVEILCIGKEGYISLKEKGQRFSKIHLENNENVGVFDSNKID